MGYIEKTGQWVVKCEPHVSLRFKRVFAKAEPWRCGYFLLKDTPENANDLVWFMQRYPLTNHEVERLSARSQEYREGLALIDKLLSNQIAPIPFELAIPARDYQKVAANIVLTKGGLLLADDVGIGKTASAICVLTDPRARPALVVTLTSLPFQWRDELQKFAPQLRVAIIKRGQPYDLCKGKPFPDVVIINYHKIASWGGTLAKIIKTVIWDECQELRHPGTQKYSAATELATNAQFRMGLSATPFYNYGGEMFNVVECILPEALGARNEFVLEWCERWSGDKPKIADPIAFGTYLRENGIMLRRTRAEVGREIPEVTRVSHHVDANLAALDRVEESCAALARTILGDNESFRGQKMQASEELSNTLRQATGIAKAPYVADFVKLLLESDEAVVLYGWHREVYSIWLDLLKDFNPVLYTGSESLTQKEASKQAFIRGQTKLIIISLRSGAGLDGLQQVCRTAVFGEIDWSPGVHEQNIGRIHRDGQKDPVLAYFLVTPHGSDPIVAEVCGLKGQQIEGVRGDNPELIQTLQTDGGHIKRLAEQYLRKRETVLQ